MLRSESTFEVINMMVDNETARLYRDVMESECVSEIRLDHLEVAILAMRAHKLNFLNAYDNLDKFNKIMNRFEAVKLANSPHKNKTVKTQITGDYINLAGANISCFDLSDRNFMNSRNLQHLNLSNVYGMRVNFSRSDLHAAIMPNAEFNQTDFTDTTLTMANLFMAKLNGSILTRADLAHANLEDAVLTGTVLWKTNFGYANLLGADLSRSTITDARFVYANLHSANLSNSNLMRANLRFANLTNANLVNADFMDADLTGADLTGATFFNVDMLLSQSALSDALDNYASMIDGHKHDDKLRSAMKADLNKQLDRIPESPTKNEMKQLIQTHPLITKRSAYAGLHASNMLLFGYAHVEVEQHGEHHQYDAPRFPHQ